MWGAILSGLGKLGGAIKANPGKFAELGTSLIGAKMQDSGAKKANALEAAIGGREALTTPTARRDAISLDSDIAQSQAQAGSLANNMADRTNTQALKMAILQGANMGGVSAPSFLAGRTGTVSGPQWSPDQIATLRDAWGKDNANVQTSIDDLRKRQTSPLQQLTMNAAQSEDERIRKIMPMMEQQAMESGILGSKYEKQTPWWQKWLLPAVGAVGGAALLGKFGGSGEMGPESKIPGMSIESIIGAGKALPPESFPQDPNGIIWNSKAKLGKTGWGSK